MAESTSQIFFAALEPQRHQLWTLALSGGLDALRGEARLLKAMRAAFAAFVQSPEKTTDFASFLAEGAAQSFDPAAAEIPMPAAVWARLWGAIQIDAAKLGTAKNLRPDSVLLSPDPLLAPKKPKPAEDFSDIVPPSRLLVVGTLLALLAFVLILFVTTRHSAPPTTEPAATQSN